MKNKVGVNNYNFSSKNKWRVQLWAKIKSRVRLLGKKPKDCIVLYLGSDQDLDRKLAVRYGFNPNNLIPVEVDKNKIKKLREEKKNVIEGDLFDILKSWPETTPIDVINADLCCGMEWKVVRAFHDSVYFNQNKTGMVIAFNMQRGREATIKNINAAMGYEYNTKHRGIYLFGVLTSAMFIPRNNGDILNKLNRKLKNILALRHKVLIDHIGLNEDKLSEDDFIWSKDSHITMTERYIKADEKISTMERKTRERYEATIKEREFLKKQAQNLFTPEFLSYKGKRVYMDSVIINNRIRPKPITSEDREYITKSISSKELKKYKSRIRAALAIRTMKNSGKLSSSPNR